MNIETKDGQAVRTQREKLGLTQRDLAARVGCAQMSLCRVERGERGARGAFKHAIADALEQPVEDLFAATFAAMPAARRARELATLDQTDVGSLAGIQQPVVSRIELGLSGVSPERRAAVAAVLGIDAAELEPPQPVVWVRPEDLPTPNGRSARR